MPEDAKDTVRFLCEKGNLEVVRHRARARMVTWVKSMVDSKKSEEVELHASMHPEVAKVITGINIIALEEICKSVGFVDEYLFRGLREGFSLSGIIPPTGRWEMRHRPSAICEEQWASLRPSFCKNVLQRTTTSGNPMDDACLWDVTCNERDKSWLVGPVDVANAFKKFGDGLAPARRFLVRQKGNPGLLMIIQTQEPMLQSSLGRNPSCNPLMSWLCT